MKKTLILFGLLASSFGGFPQRPAENNAPLAKQQEHSLFVLGELWGFLKYYHPAVAKGLQDWDSVLLKKIPLYLAAKNKEDVSRVTIGWLDETGTPPVCSSCDNHVPDSLQFNLDLSWINEDNFSKAVTQRLLFIRDNRNQGGNRYVSWRNSSLQFIEKVYNTPAFQYPTADYRLLLLFRYWSLVNYFSPYKYICGADWKDILREKIPAFYNAADTAAYQLEYVKLVAALNDGHANFRMTPVLERYWGKNYYPPFYCRFIDNQLVVSHIFNDSLAALTHMKPGDVILEVNHEKVMDKWARLADYLCASNEVARQVSFSSWCLFTAGDSSFVVKKIRAGITMSDTFVMPRYTGESVDTSRPWRILGGNIGYVNMGTLVKKQVDSAMRALRDTRGIIFDIRNYPNNTWDSVARYLCAKPFVMCRMTMPDMDYPGVFRFRSPRQVGQVNDRPYAGKLVILANETSASHAEFSIMGLQAAANSFTIGSTTKGQDGDFSKPLWLPGGLATRFSCLGIYYPDGTIAQRKGVKIDKIVNPTIKGLQAGRDELLEEGIKYINSK